MKAIDYAIEALVAFQKKHEDYLETAKQYQEYAALPFWKKWFCDRVEKPEKDYLYECVTLYYNWPLRIELRMSFFNDKKEISLAVNESNCGYKLNVDTMEKSYYLGRVNPEISSSTESLLIAIRNKLAPYIIE